LLEDYNGWNLPFAKTVEISGRNSNQDGYDGSYPVILGANSYKMEVDPSALFTVLFLKEAAFTGYDSETMTNVTLDYTFLGNVA